MAQGNGVAKPPQKIDDNRMGSFEFAGNRATARVLVILSRFSDGSSSHGVSELSRQLGMTKNMVHRALKTLTRFGYLVRDESGSRYQLGPGVLQLGQRGLEPLNLPLLAAPYIESMRDASNETVSLAVPMGGRAVTIAGLRGRGDIARAIPFGRSVPLHASPAARVMLAFMPDEEIQAYLDGGPLERFTPSTVVKPKEIWSEVELIRERGYAMGRGDHVSGATGIGFPVLANDGLPHGSLTIAGPVSRLPAERLEELKPALLSIVDELNRHSQLYPAVQVSQPDPR